MCISLSIYIHIYIYILIERERERERDMTQDISTYAIHAADEIQLIHARHVQNAYIVQACLYMLTGDL